METLARWAASITAIIGLGVLLWRPSRRQARRWAEFWADWYGVEDRPGVPGRPGVMHQLAEHGELIRQIRAELQPNHGSSLRDDINRLLVAQGLQPGQPGRVYESAAAPRGRHRAPDDDDF